MAAVLLKCYSLVKCNKMIQCGNSRAAGFICACTAGTIGSYASGLQSQRSLLTCRESYSRSAADHHPLCLYSFVCVFMRHSATCWWHCCNVQIVVLLSFCDLFVHSSIGVAWILCIIICVFMQYPWLHAYA